MSRPPQQETFPLLGVVIASETQAGVHYHLEHGVGEGGMGTAYLARRQSENGSAPVVVKVMRSDLVGGEVAPDLIALKESVALSRLNQMVPPSPFVVRFVDAGTAALASSARTPWTAIEYVHGGVEGTTLEERVTYSIHKTGYAFDPVRAAHAVRCLSAGLSAIHGVGVIHRDLTPGNVLCCGFGAREIFKIADFGVARASGLKATFDGLCLGTVGYSSPEAAGASAGPPTDVFSFAAVVYYLLTGQRYFAAESPVEALQLVLSPSRPRIADHPTLSPELSQQADACAAIDDVLAQASGLDWRKRPETPLRFAAELLASLGQDMSGPRSSRELLSAVQSSRSHSTHSHHFIVRSRPQADFRLQSVAWDADGHALALHEHGGRFWNGDTWLDAAPLLSKLPGRQAFTHRNEAEGWLVGGESLSVVDGYGVGQSLSPPRAGLSFLLASGRVDDLLLAVAVDSSHTLSLWPVSARRFLRPLPLPGVDSVLALQRLDDSRFLIGGVASGGTAFAALVSPLEWEIQRLDVPAIRAFVGGASAPERATALLAGTQGVVLRVEQGAHSVETLPGAPNLHAAAIDVQGRQWLSSQGTLWTRERSEDPWVSAWHDERWEAPFVSLMAEPGLVLAMTSDGAILEGQAPV